jgi:hypothetical protein
MSTVFLQIVAGGGMTIFANYLLKKLSLYVI